MDSAKNVFETAFFMPVKILFSRFYYNVSKATAREQQTIVILPLTFPICTLSEPRK